MSRNKRLSHVQREYERLRVDQPHLTHEEVWRQAEQAVPYKEEYSIGDDVGRFFLKLVVVIGGVLLALLAFAFGVLAFYEARL